MVAVVTPGDLGSEFDLGVVTPSKITVLTGTDTVAGKLKIVKAAAYPAQSANDVSAATPAYVTAAIAALPADKYLSSLGSYNTATNVLTLNMNDGSTVPVDLTGLVNDAVASVPAATDTTTGVVSLAVAANYPSASNVEATTPAYVTAAVNGQTHIMTGTVAPSAAPAAGVKWYINTATTPNNLYYYNGTAWVQVGPASYTLPAATDTVVGGVSLAVAANYPSVSDVEATTPAYVTSAVNGQTHIMTGTVAPSAAPAAGVKWYINTATTPNNLYYYNGTAWVQVGPASYTLPAATDTVVGGVSLAVAANMPSTSDVEAATPAYVNAKLAQAGALPVLITNAFGVAIARGGNP